MQKLKQLDESPPLEEDHSTRANTSRDVGATI